MVAMNHTGCARKLIDHVVNKKYITATVGFNATGTFYPVRELNQAQTDYVIACLDGQPRQVLTSADMNNLADPVPGQENGDGNAVANPGGNNDGNVDDDDAGDHDDNEGPPGDDGDDDDDDSEGPPGDDGDGYAYDDGDDDDDDDDDDNDDDDDSDYNPDDNGGRAGPRATGGPRIRGGVRAPHWGVIDVNEDPTPNVARKTKTRFNLPSRKMYSYPTNWPKEPSNKVPRNKVKAIPPEAVVGVIPAVVAAGVTPFLPPSQPRRATKQRRTSLPYKKRKLVKLNLSLSPLRSNAPQKPRPVTKNHTSKEGKKTILAFSMENIFGF